MSNELYEAKDYKKYLINQLSKSKTYGQQSRLAKALSCKPAFVTQVLHGNKHLSLEQAEATSRYLGMNSDETHYFLTLLLFARAGTRELRSLLEKQLSELTQKKLQLHRNIDVKPTLGLEHQVKYYSRWYFSAVHIALTIPRLQTAEALSQELNLPLAKIRAVLNYLVKIGLAINASKGRFQASTERIHLGNDSELIQQHHINWRLQAMQSLEKQNANPDLDEDFHYSSVVSLSENDILNLRVKIIGFIQECKTIIKNSNEEKLACFNLDFYKI